MLKSRPRRDTGVLSNDFGRVPRCAVLIAICLCAELQAERFDLQYAGADELPVVEIGGEPVKIHTQGLYVSDQHYLVTGRLEETPKRAVLLRFKRDDLPSYEFVDITPAVADEQSLDHPGGFDVDSQGHFWIPLSTSHRRGPSLICRYQIDAGRPLAEIKLESSIRLDDHIGAICLMKDDALVGASWDTKQIYSWKPDGTLLSRVDRNEVFPESPNWQVAVQDWKNFEPGSNQILLGGIDKSNVQQQATIQLVDLVERKILETHVFEPRDEVSRPLTNEGLAVHDDTLYLLPEDLGGGARVLRFQLSGSKAGD